MLCKNSCGSFPLHPFSSPLRPFLRYTGQRKWQNLANQTGHLQWDPNTSSAVVLPLPAIVPLKCLCICFGFEKVLKFEEKISWQERFTTWRWSFWCCVVNFDSFKQSSGPALLNFCWTGMFTFKTVCLWHRKRSFEFKWPWAVFERLTLACLCTWWLPWSADYMWPQLTSETVNWRKGVSRWVVFLFICLSAPWKKSVVCHHCNVTL